MAMNVLAAIGDGNMLMLVFGIAVGLFAGWFIPQPACIKRFFGG